MGYFLQPLLSEKRVEQMHVKFGGGDRGCSEATLYPDAVARQDDHRLPLDPLPETFGSAICDRVHKTGEGNRHIGVGEQAAAHGHQHPPLTIERDREIMQTPIGAPYL